MITRSSWHAHLQGPVQAGEGFPILSRPRPLNPNSLGQPCCGHGQICAGSKLSEKLPFALVSSNWRDASWERCVTGIELRDWMLSPEWDIYINFQHQQSAENVLAEVKRVEEQKEGERALKSRLLIQYGHYGQDPIAAGVPLQGLTQSRVRVWVGI